MSIDLMIVEKYQASTEFFLVLIIKQSVVEMGPHILFFWLFFFSS